MPSIDPAPLKKENGDPFDHSIYLADVLRKHMPTGNTPRASDSDPTAHVIPAVGTGGAFECPNDRPGMFERGAPNTNLSYYQSEKTSYGFRTELNGVSPTEFSKNLHHHYDYWRRHSDENVNLPVNSIWFARDFNNFHGHDNGGFFVPKMTPARRYVYIDGHVGDYEN